MRGILLVLVLLMVVRMVGAVEPGHGFMPSGVNAAINNVASNDSGQNNSDNAVRVEGGAVIRARAGNYDVGDGERVKISNDTNNRIRIHAGNIEAETKMEIFSEETQNRTRFRVNLSNGKNAEIKIMPDRASEKAIERLRLRVCNAENNCTIELKEVGEGNQTRAAYEIQAEKRARLFGIFSTKMEVQAQVDADSGEVIRARKPWWAFLASED